VTITVHAVFARNYHFKFIGWINHKLWKTSSY